MIYNKEIRKIHGPYQRQDKRFHVVIVFSDNTKKTVSYPKYLMEQFLGRELHPDEETIDHLDGDFTNNDISNLRIINRSSHIKDDIKRVELVEIECVLCGIKIKKKGKDLAYDKKKGMFWTFLWKILCR